MTIFLLGDKSLLTFFPKMPTHGEEQSHHDVETEGILAQLAGPQSRMVTAQKQDHCLHVVGTSNSALTGMSLSPLTQDLIWGHSLFI